MVFASAPAFAGAPVIDAFTASPPTAVPGQIISLTLQAHDPDCAASCTTGCGATIRDDLFSWSDDTGRTGQFANSTTSPAGSPFTASVDWTAPPADGTYTISAYVADSGGFICGGRQSTIANLIVSVSSVTPPVIDSFDVTPLVVNAGGTVSLSCTAHDPESRTISYAFFADSGTISHSGSDTPLATWAAPSSSGIVTVGCRITVPDAPAVVATKSVEVSIADYNGKVVLSNIYATRLEPLPDGNIATVDWKKGSLAVLSRSGAVIWERSGLARPVAVSLLGNALYVLEQAGRKVSKWSLSGSGSGSFIVEGSRPNDMSANPARNELAISDTAQRGVRIVDPVTGATRAMIGQGTLIRPAGIWYGGEELAVADMSNARVYVFDPSGNLISTIGDDTIFARPQAVTFDPFDETWIVADSFSGEIHVIDRDGTVRGQLGGFGASVGETINPIDVTFIASPREVAVPTLQTGIHFFALTSTLPAPEAAGLPQVTDRLGDDGEALVITWAMSPDDPLRVDRYFVERDTGGNGVFVRLAELPAGTTSWIDLAAGDGTCHSYVVVASDGIMHTPSAVSACAFAINDLPPPTPTIVTAAATTPFDASLVWTAVTALDLSGYVLDISGAEGSRSLSFGPGLTSATIDSLNPGQQYTLTIRAFDTANNFSSPSQSLLTTYTDEGPPAPATLVSTDTQAGGTVSTTWTMGSSDVPVDHYFVEYEPINQDWPTLTSTVTDLTELKTGLINQLSYTVRVHGITPWGREGEVATTTVAPTAPSLLIPILQRAGREGTSGIEDSAGLTVTLPFGDATRELRFIYRTVASEVALSFNGRQLPSILPDTNGSWVEASVMLDRTATDPGINNVLQIVSTSFPAYSAEAAFDRLDLVPLPAAGLRSTGFETVVDIEVARAEARSDLQLSVELGDSRARDIGKVAAHGGYTSGSVGHWEPVDCRNPLGHVCRDAFRTPRTHFVYRVGIRSPAGWLSTYDAVQAQTHPPNVPPPVTDLSATTINHAGGDRYRLDWTPLSFLDSATKEIRPIPTYRVYATDGSHLLFRDAVTQPPYEIPVTMLPTGYSFVVRSVDNLGSESE